MTTQYQNSSNAEYKGGEMAVINKLKILLLFFAEFGESNYKVWADGKFDGIGDAWEYADDIPELTEVIKNWKDIKAEFPLLKTDAGRAEAIAYLKTEFDIADDVLETFIESLIEDGEKVFDGIMNIIDKLKPLFGKKIGN